ncbi:MAG: glutamate-cysteine ligase family protein [Gammaproteobacteria bacterium]|nr:glutamate-cysteine ligase family protein [Gammaproteobacteria bacterium]
MGLSIDRCTFSDDEYVKAGIRLRENLAALRELLERPGFGVGPASLGAELEMSIVGPDAKALPVNREVLAQSLDPHLQLELDRFNLEYNLSPVQAAGRPFETMQKELELALDVLGKTAAQFDGRIVPIGILPTLTIEELQSGWMTDLPRYHALCAGISRLREGGVQIRINGPEPLQAEFETCTVEGANTSFQVHLRVDPERFAPCYNAAQLATPLALAISANSPYFLGHRLWEETRIALFKQSVDTRRHHHEWRRMARVPFGHGWVRKGAYELFAESCYLYPILMPVFSDADDLGVVRGGGIPALAELRLQQGTIWNWNRPVYDAADGGHLRIELRALPAGPTPIDMMVNAAYLAGLTAGLANHVDRMLDAFPFRYADFNFYRAAQQGLDARLLWPTLDGTSPREATAAELCREMLPIADEGLQRIGVDEPERKGLLGLVRDRLDSGTTPAAWQRRTVESMDGVARDEAMRRLVEEYLAKTATGRPVTEW